MSDRPEWIITAEELKGCMGSVTLLDVREPEEYAEARIEGCTLIPLGELQSRAESELDQGADIVVYCAHGVRSLQALMALKLMGFRKLRSLEGGIAAWQEMNNSRSNG